MDDIILKVENISKQYRLGVVGTGTLSHDLNRLWHKVRGKEDPYLTVGAVNDRSAVASSDYVWALKDINFEVKQGEILGIIGKNGAGKSTLLKILSRVTSPTTGSIKTRGRIASLLEVGTGMHPELTGRENVYLNGAILGMTKAEIASKIEEIIDFSGCEMYIDTPVKRYSSGMRVRLGFAVAAFLEPDILVVDEVLAVGDAEFQKKAIGKMQDISNTSGRTVLFVSHDMSAIETLCDRAILLENGQIVYTDSSEKVVSRYLQTSVKHINNEVLLEEGNYVKRIRINHSNTQEKIFAGEVFDFSVFFQKRDLSNVTLGYLISNHKHQNLLAANMQQYATKFSVEDPKNELRVLIDNLPLAPGLYNMSIFFGNGAFDVDILRDVLTFKVSWKENKNIIKPHPKWGNVYSKTKWLYQ